jgi:Ca2+-binding RTX toxin-like protein
MLTGNAGDDHLDGGAGTDTCDGGSGVNMVVNCDL